MASATVKVLVLNLSQLIWFLLAEIQVQPFSDLMGTGGSFPGDKRLGCEVDNASRPSVEVKNEWSYTSTLPYVFMVLN
jgi:hypothetical protein